MCPLNFRLRSDETSSMTSSSSSLHSWVVIQSLPLKSAFTDDLLKSRYIGKMNAPRVADRFAQHFELEIRKHVDNPRCHRAFPTQRLVIAQPNFDNRRVVLEPPPIRRRLERQRIRLSRNRPVNGLSLSLWGRLAACGGIALGLFRPPLDINPIPPHVLPIRLQTHEKPRLLHVRSP